MRAYFDVNRPSVWTALSLVVQVFILVLLVVGILSLRDVVAATQASPSCGTGEIGFDARPVKDCDQLIADRLAEIQSVVAADGPPACTALPFGSDTENCFQIMVNTLREINVRLDHQADGLDEVEGRLLEIEGLLAELCRSLC